MMLRFPQTHNPWIDAGIVGFEWYVRDELPSDLSLNLLPDCLEIKGEETSIKDFLEKQFWRLVEEWYNASSIKQKEKEEGYYFDPKTKSFVTFAKSSPKGLAALLFDAAAQDYEGPSWYRKNKKDRSGKETSMLDPQEAREWAEKAGIQEDIQELLDEFLRKSGRLKEGEPRPESSTQVLLWGRRNLRVPKIPLWADDSKPTGICSISGETVGKVVPLKGNQFPFAVGSDGHVNFTPNWSSNEKVGWKTAYIALFAPVIGFWLGGHGDPHLIGAIPVAGDLLTLKKNVIYMQNMMVPDDTLQKNFKITLKAIQFSKEPEERFIAFFERLFQLTLQARDYTPLNDVTEYETIILPQELENGAPTAFLLIEAQKGQKWDIKHAEVYQDPIYLLRLFSRMYIQESTIFDNGEDYLGSQKAPEELSWGQVHLNFNTFLTQLEDQTKSTKRQRSDNNRVAHLTRREVIRRILHKQPTLQILVTHAFSINRESGKPRPISEIVKFAEIYEPLFWRKDMIEDREKFLRVAKELGEHIAIVVHNHDNGRKNRLYKLRRALKLSDFLREINTLQERFDLTVPEEIGTGLLGNHNFAEFRGFCLLNALNKFNQMSYAKSKQSEGEG